jgi:hypothetical protein
MNFGVKIETWSTDNETCCLHLQGGGGVIFDTENGSRTFLRKIGKYLPDYVTLHLRRK